MEARSHLGRPAADEHAPYYGRYIGLVPEEDVLAVLAGQLDEVLPFLHGLADRADHRYAPGKWSIKEVVGHVTDTERVMAYRALRFARGDETPVPGFEQDDWMRHSPFGACRLADLVDEWGHVRRANIAFFRQLAPEAWSRRGTASGNPVTVRALAYILPGHVRHHLNVLRERYLGETPPA
jgi:hypothetical protein